MMMPGCGGGRLMRLMSAQTMGCSPRLFVPLPPLPCLQGCKLNGYCNDYVHILNTCQCQWCTEDKKMIVFLYIYFAEFCGFAICAFIIKICNVRTGPPKKLLICHKWTGAMACDLLHHLCLILCINVSINVCNLCMTICEHILSIFPSIFPS